MPPVSIDVASASRGAKTDSGYCEMFIVIEGLPNAAMKGKTSVPLNLPNAS